MRKKYNYLKTIVAMAGILLISVNCTKDILEQPNPNAFTPNLFWKTQADAEKGIIGTYSTFTHIWYYTRFEIFASDYRDDVVNGFATSERTALGSFNGVSTANGTKWVWAAMFKGISRANEVLYNVPNIEMEQIAKDNIMGEAYFIRAYNYMALVNSWLNVPLITLPMSEIPDPIAIEQADPTDVWAQIISDLEMAADLLPSSWPANQKGRITDGAAIGMLGKALLYNKDYQGAKDAFEIIMDGRFKLTANYGDNFTEAAENNSESLFEIQMINDGNGGWGSDAPGSGKGAAFHPDLAPRGFTGQDGMRINDWVLDLFLDEKTVNNQIDPRAFTTLFFDTEETTDYQGEVLSSKTYSNLTYQEAFPGGTHVWANKHLDQAYNGRSRSDEGGWHGSGNNLRILRYADVLLMYAEAEFMLNGSTTKALDAINEVRRRSDMPDFTTITMQDIEDERVKELSLERTRYFDILRWGKVVEYIVNKPELKSESAGTSSYKPGREYIDIPQNERDTNPKFKPNPGY
ncbi:Starch-binding associating with outer membrane [Lutibacter agarilyticus]|uniref:Starch-binding associating with outer membrane n=1 Tax=Lutibacter agarilyticus TaxID=1109740 RepID=A0A238VCX2_9FLAO|nr:RagB/SusD family nutrient uptake outer membrane protein [Lutibacter agarilyticus]SNR31379.1 Starch-binding associating with outer membrane [Lutibacter agarilyticus]